MTGVALGVGVFSVLIWVTNWRVEIAATDSISIKWIALGLSGTVAWVLVVSWMVRPDTNSRRATLGFSLVAAGLLLQWLASVTPRHAHLEAFGQVLLAWVAWSLVWLRSSVAGDQMGAAPGGELFSLVWIVAISALWLWTTTPNLTSGSSALLAVPTLVTFRSATGRRARDPRFLCAILVLGAFAFFLHRSLVDFQYRRVATSSSGSLRGPFGSGPDAHLSLLIGGPWKGSRVAILDGDRANRVFLLLLPAPGTDPNEVGPRVTHPSGHRIADRWYLVRGLLGSTTDGWNDDGLDYLTR